MSNITDITDHIRKSPASKLRVASLAESTVTFLNQTEPVAARRQLMSQLNGSVQFEKEEQEYRRLDCERIKAVITYQLGKLRENSSPDAAIKFLEDTLAAIHPGRKQE